MKDQTAAAAKRKPYGSEASSNMGGIRGETGGLGERDYGLRARNREASEGRTRIQDSRQAVGG